MWVHLEISKVNRDTDLADKLIHFVENFSWEAVFVAMAGGQIVGMTSIMKTDYYPLPEIYPWISCVFVTEEYRGHRISEKLIDFANVYAKENGFNRTYIPSEHIGLYEKYGYCYIKDIVNFGNGTDRLYVKELANVSYPTALFPCI
ncbi:MAG: GNAT family N-acetyltransferase [Bacillus sp. (in: Bacteria)]|nr:GNAT family N-acetyltransferase [Bacillus sp. (in: firmicutes)]